jgi:hypothetical protein
VPKRKRKQDDPRNMIGIINSCNSAKFALLVDSTTKTYNITPLQPNRVSFCFIPRDRKLRVAYEIYDSMDDLYQGISELASGFKENKGDHVHCLEGGKEHIHQVDDLGRKVGKCPTKRRTCDDSQKTDW